MSIKFAVLAIARSGSSYLSSTLKEHPDICMHGEIFHENTSIHIRDHAREQIDLSIREQDPIQFVNEIYKFDQGRKAVGFKVWKPQNPIAVNYIIKNQRIKKIVLERKNLLASFSSSLIAKETKVWNLNIQQSSNKKYKTPQVKFNEIHFLKYVKTIQDIYKYYKGEITAEGQDYLLVDYQQHIMNENLDTVLNFLTIGTELELVGQKVKLNKQSNILDRFIPEDHPKIIQCLVKMDQTDWLYENKIDLSLPI